MRVKSDTPAQKKIRDFVRANLYLIKEYRNSPMKQANKDARVMDLLNEAHNKGVFPPTTTKASMLTQLQKSYKTLHNFRE